MENANHDNVNELIAKHLAGESTPDEESRLLAWLSKGEENKLHFVSLKKAFELATRHVELPVTDGLNIDVDHEWDQFRESVGGRKNVRHLSGMQLWMRVAASILLILVAGAGVYYFSKNDPTTYHTAANTRTVTLPDGSRVTLNRYSRLSYNNDFGDANRTLKLDGEAFFDVTPDAQKPFVILAQNARVQVIGTTFNVNAYDSLETVEVVVETGIVTLESAKEGSKRAEVLPGEKGTISKSDERISITLNEDVNFLSWSTRHIVFVDEPLIHVIRTLEKTYNARIEIINDIPPSCIVTVTFDGQSLDAVMRVLESTLNLKYTINGNKVEIIEAGC